MSIVIAIEAGQPNGKRFRLALAVNMTVLASWVALLGRLF